MTGLLLGYDNGVMGGVVAMTDFQRMVQRSLPLPQVLSPMTTQLLDLPAF